MSHVWEHSQAKDGELLVLLALADFATEEGMAWPKMDTLARKARLTERGVQKALARLEKMGEITVERTRGRGHVNRYKVNTVHLLKPEQSSPFSPEKVNSATRKGELCDTPIPGTVRIRQKETMAVVTTGGAGAEPTPPSCDLSGLTETEKDWLRLLKSISDYPLKIRRDLPLLRRLADQHGQEAVARGLDEYRDSPRRIRPGDPNQVKRFVAQAARWQVVDASRATAATGQRPNEGAYRRVFQ